MNKSILIIIVMAIVTYLTRALPFILWGNHRKMSSMIHYLGQTLPYAMMGLLIVYSFKDLDVTVSPYGIPEFLAVVVCVLLHLWKRNNLLSISGSTILYMILIRVI